MAFPAKAAGTLLSPTGEVRLKESDTVGAGANAATVDQAGAVMEFDYGASTVLVADEEDTPTALTLDASTLLGRGVTGGITALDEAAIAETFNIVTQASLEAFLSSPTPIGDVDPNTGGFTAITITDQTTETMLTLTSTHESATAGPRIFLDRDRNVSADNDALADIHFRGKNDKGVLTTYARIIAQILDNTDATEDGYLLLQTSVAGDNVVSTMSLQDGVIIGAPAGDYKGFGTLNAEALHANTTSDDTVILRATATNDSATSGPIITLDRASDSATAGDLLADIRFGGRNDNATPEAVDYARIVAAIIDETDNAEDGELQLQAMLAGSMTGIATIGNGMQVGSPAGGYKGSGTLNAGGLYVGGVAVGTGSGTVTAVTGTSPIVSSGGTTPAISIGLATTSAQGSVELATNTEALGNATNRAVTPNNLTARMSTPGPIGNSTASTGDFTTISGTTAALTAAVTSVMLDITSTEASATAAPVLYLTRNSSSPATNDALGDIHFRGKTSTGAEETYARILAQIRDKTNGSIDGFLHFETKVANAAVSTMSLQDGVIIGNPTDDYKGFGTLNASAIYDDGAGPLTHYVIEAANTGKIDFDFWDSTMPGGQRHEPARRFSMDNLNPILYADSWKEHGHLPALPSQEEWLKCRPGTGDLVQRLIETAEVQAVHIDELTQRVIELEKK